MEEKLDLNKDYCIDDEIESGYVRVRVGNISLLIKKDEEGVVVDFYNDKTESEDPFHSTYVMYSEED